MKEENNGSRGKTKGADIAKGQNKMHEGRNNIRRRNSRITGRNKKAQMLRKKMKSLGEKQEVQIVPRKEMKYMRGKIKM